MISRAGLEVQEFSLIENLRPFASEGGQAEHAGSRLGGKLGQVGRKTPQSPRIIKNQIGFGLKYEYGMLNYYSRRPGL